jgi:hypothetical protein
MNSERNRLLKNAHLRRSPHPSSLRRTFKYASLLRISGALHLGIFDQPAKNYFFNRIEIPDLTVSVRSSPDFHILCILSVILGSRCHRWATICSQLFNPDLFSRYLSNQIRVRTIQASTFSNNFPQILSTFSCYFSYPQ